MSIYLNFDEQRWQKLKHRWNRWWLGDLDEPLVVVETKKPQFPNDVPAFINQLPFDMPTDQVVDIYQKVIENTNWHGDAWPKWFINFGPGIIAGFLGAKVLARQDTVWFEPPMPLNLQQIIFRYNPDNIWLRRVRDITQTAVNRWKNQVAISHTDLGGNFDILNAFRPSEKLLLDLYDQPDTVQQLINQISSLWIDYYELFYDIIRKNHRGTTPWAAIWSEKKCYMLQCDFAYMISPDMFEQFVVPDLITCCKHLDHAFYHLDGVGQIPHLDALLSIDSLHGIQWVPGAGQPSHSHWLDLLKRIRDAGKLCQLYTFAADAIKIVNTLGPKGFAFYILDDLTPDDADDLVNTLKQK